MKSKEFITESNLKIVNPFRYDWKIYKNSWGNIHPITTIKNKNIGWEFLARFPSAKYGKFSAIQDKDMHLYQLTKYTQSDLYMAYLYAKWDRGNANTRNSMMPEILNHSSKISNIFKKATSKLRRGIHLSTKQLEKLKAGESIKLNQTVISSWTSNNYSAYSFTNGRGIIIEKKFSPADIIVNFEKIDDVFHIPSERWTSEDEVIIKGNGIGSVLNPTTEKISAVSFTKQEFESGNISVTRL